MNKQVIVLKFGGSVLTSEESLGQIVTEIYRYVRQGLGVVTVVSAFKGVTDQLAGLARQFGGGLQLPAARYLLATGEYRSAAMVSLAAERVGLSSVVLQPHEIGLSATGEPDDATPAGLDTERLRLALDGFDFVVVPGFVALDERERTVLLGRGGTDLSAVFLATRLPDARVRLLKDVDAVFDRDPVKSGGAAQAFSELTWETAVRVAHPLVQDKAVQLAWKHELPIEVAALGRGYETIIGARTAVRTNADGGRRLRVAVLGCGVVGGGVIDRLAAEPETFEIASILVRDLGKRAHHSHRSLFTTDPQAFIDSSADVFVDTGLGAEPSRTLSRAFRERGAFVVSANKQALVGDEALTDADRRSQGASFLYSAAVGGGAPFLEAVGRVRGGVRSIRGVLNGTSNFVLQRCLAGPSFAEAVREAQHEGFAEADPAADLDGSDAAAKIRLIGLAAWGRLPPAPDVREELTEAAASAVGERVLKQVARCSLGTDDMPVCEVRVEGLSPDDFLAGTNAEENRLEIELDSGEVIRVCGKGAGRFPTVEAVLADLFDTFRSLAPSEPSS